MLECTATGVAQLQGRSTPPFPPCLLQFGKKLRAAMIRKLQEGDVTTQWSLTYKLNTRLRRQFNLNQFDKTIMFQYAS